MKRRSPNQGRRPGGRAYLWEKWKAVLLRRHPNVDPNFYVSYPYLEASGARLKEEGGWLWWEADDVCLFPPIHPIWSYRKEAGRSPVDFIWSGFKDPLSGFRASMLDWEYVYDPSLFDSLSGRKWSVFRKNIRKWPRSHPDYSYLTSEGKLEGLEEGTRQLLLSWLKRREEDAEDPEVLVRMVVDPPWGTRHCYLIDERGEVASLAIWDTNWAYVNFRFLISREEPFLDEFSRYCFYRFINQAHPHGVEVNDGGTLGRSGLEAFKDKLHPVRKTMICSWKRIM